MWRRMPKSFNAEHSALLDWIGSQCLVDRSAASMGLRRPRLAGMLMQACCSLPWRHSRSLRGTFFQQRRPHSSDCRRSCFSAGSLMQHLMPSNTQPRISLRMSHSPPPCCSFLRVTGSSSVPLVTKGGGNTEWIPCRRAWERWHNCAGSVVWARCMKSSMYTSSRCRKSDKCWSVVSLVQRSGGTRYSSSGCAGREPILWVASVSLMSWAVSKVAQKYDALLHQPIWRHEGITNCVGSSSVSLGRTYAKCH